MLSIGVVIPIIQNTYIYKLLDMIGHNSVVPDHILIIDNSQQNVIVSTQMHLCIMRPEKPFSVNESWNFGMRWMIEHKVDLIGVFNDDLLIEKYFFEKLQNAAVSFSEGKVFCPETVKDKCFIDNVRNVPVQCRKMNRREGWAWTIRSEIASQTQPIPNDLKTFCGDDWFWHQSQPWIKMIGNYCFHYIGRSVKMNDTRKDLRTEKSLLAQHLK
jgi:hypothetical protein